MLSPRIAEDVAFLGYLAIPGLNLTYVLGALLNERLGAHLALLLAAKDPLLYLLTTALACVVVWMEVVPHPPTVRAERRRVLGRNMSVLSILILLLWLAAALVLPKGGLPVALALLSEGRFIPMMALTLLLAGLLPAGSTHMSAPFRDVARYLPLALAPIAVYILWKARVAVPYLGVVVGLLLVWAWALVVLESRKPGV